VLESDDEKVIRLALSPLLTVSAYPLEYCSVAVVLAEPPYVVRTVDDVRPRAHWKVYVSAAATATSETESLIESGSGLAATDTPTAPADSTLSVCVFPEPLTLLPVAVYTMPLLRKAAAPVLRVAYVFTLSVWNVGDGVVQAYRCLSSLAVYAVDASW
jgi:hypothetical protein